MRPVTDNAEFWDDTLNESAFCGLAVSSAELARDILFDAWWLEDTVKCMVHSLLSTASMEPLPDAVTARRLALQFIQSGLRSLAEDDDWPEEVRTAALDLDETIQREIG
jgi:hypothetical protein